MKCRIDKNEDTVNLFSLGNLYISDFISNDHALSEEDKTPLELCLSRKSGLVQLRHTADFDKMYKRYWYNSGTNKTMTNELFGLVKNINELVRVYKNDIWVDIGCNDGTLLSAVDSGIIRVGFDPATNNCKMAYHHADVVFNDYFNSNLYKSKALKKAKVITSIAMFYDLPDPAKFCKDIYDILEDDGLWVVQMSYLPLMLDQMAFDNICHEHLEYYSLTTMKYLLENNGFRIVDCQINDINGGSFRIYIQKDVAGVSSFSTAPHRSVSNFRVSSMLNNEKLYDLKNPSTYIKWFDKINKLKEEVVSFITNEVSRGKSVWAYGASTKGNTLLQYFGLDNTLIMGIAERQTQKDGLKTIGTNIPIYSEEYVRSKNPDYMLVLPWHFINEFKEREANFLNNGGKFIVPCPKFEIIGK